MLFTAYHEKNVGERAAKIRAIDIMAFLFWHIDFRTLGTVYFNPRCPDFLAHAYRKCGLSIAEHSGTYSKGGLNAFFFHDGESFGGDYVSGVNESIDICGLLIDGEISKWLWRYL